MRQVLTYFLYAALAVAAVISFALVFPAYHERGKMRALVAQRQAELDRKNAECKERKRLLEDLDNNPKAIEKVAREKYNLHRSGDIIYKYSPGDLEQDRK